MLEVALSSEGWPLSVSWLNLAERAAREALRASSYSHLLSAPFNISISIKLSDNDEVQALNAQWRGKDKPTNVLSFPMLDGDEIAELSHPRHTELVSGSISSQKPKIETEKWMLKQVQHDGELQEVLLGDIILAHTVCATEAEEKQIPLTQHVTHLIVHGTLHLLGYDHIDDTKAEHMEALEVKALASLGLANPY
jgi:probable rRNA maturation factor